MSSIIIRQCSRRIVLWCVVSEILIIGSVACCCIDAPIGRIEGIVLTVCVSALGAFIFKVVSSQNPARVIRHLQAEPLQSGDAPEILASIHRFSVMAGIPIVRVCQTTARRVSTVSVGWAPASSVIILNLRALEVLTPEELDSMIAIEIAHIKFRDHLLRSIIMSTAGLGYLLLAGLVLQIAEVYRDVGEDVKNGRDPRLLSGRRLFYLIGGPVAFGLIPSALVFGIPIRAIITGQEYRADASSAQAVGSVVPPASAILKLAATIAARKNYLRDYSVFRVVQPGQRKWIEKCLYSFLYPTCVTRIKRLGACMHGLD